MKDDDSEIIIWLIGLISLVIGCGLAWGWVASLIAFGLIVTLWPLIKQLAR